MNSVSSIMALNWLRPGMGIVVGVSIQGVAVQVVHIVPREIQFFQGSQEKKKKAARIFNLKELLYSSFETKKCLDALLTKHSNTQWPLDCI